MERGDATHRPCEISGNWLVGQQSRNVQTKQLQHAAPANLHVVCTAAHVFVCPLPPPLLLHCKRRLQPVGTAGCTAQLAQASRPPAMHATLAHQAHQKDSQERPRLRPAPGPPPTCPPPPRSLQAAPPACLGHPAAAPLPLPHRLPHLQGAPAAHCCLAWRGCAPARGGAGGGRAVRLLLRRRFVLGRVGSHAARQVPDGTPLIKPAPVRRPAGAAAALSLAGTSAAGPLCRP